MASIEGNKESQVRETALSGTSCPFAYGNFWKCPIKSNEDDPKNVKFDKHGIPLIPQPNQHKDDPLNWPGICKLCIALQISFLAMLGPMSAAAINPILVPLAQQFNITTLTASYHFALFLFFEGIGALIALPLSNIYGRRPVYLLGNALAGVMNVTAAYCTMNWTAVMVTRAANGLGVGATISIGVATLNDMYFTHERPFYIGIYSLFVSNGIFFGHLIGGYIAEKSGWVQNCFSIPGYIQLGLFATTLVTLPESIYDRTALALHCPTYKPREYWDLLLFCPLTTSSLHISAFLKPFKTLKHISISLPAIYAASASAYGNILFAITSAQLFTSIYSFTLSQIGLLMSIPLLIGSVIGELNARWICEWIMPKHNAFAPKAEIRLDALWLALLLPIGVTIQGVALQNPRGVRWVGAAVGMGIAGCGWQVAGTVVRLYTQDCFPSQSEEISSILYALQQMFAAVVAFYAIPLSQTINIQFAWLTFALINVAFLLPMFVLRRYGARWRGATEDRNGL